MNTPGNFELAKLLKEKGFVFRQYETYHNPVNGFTKYEEITPTVSEVVMWLYEKHGIWVSVIQNEYEDKFQYTLTQRKTDSWYVVDNGKLFNSPTEAYEAAIEYTLTKLI